MKLLLSTKNIALAGLFTLATQTASALEQWVRLPADGPGLWTDGANWDLNFPPFSNEEGRIDNGGTAVIDVTQTDPNTGVAGEILTGSVTLGSQPGASGNLFMTNGVLYIQNTDVRIGGNPVVAIGGTVPAIGGTGIFTQIGGSVIENAGNLNIGLRGTAPLTDTNVASGTYNLSEADTNFPSLYEVRYGFVAVIGNRAKGTLNQSGGTLEVKGIALTGNAAGTNGSLIHLGRNALVGTSYTSGTYNLSGGIARSAIFRFGATTTNTSTNVFSLSGTGKLQTRTIDFLAPAAGGSTTVNIINFTGGTLSSHTNALSITNNGGTLSPYTIDFTTVSPLTSATITPIGTMVFTRSNSYNQVSGTLAIDISSTGNDFVDIGASPTDVGTASLAGTIAVNVLDGFEPASGATFDILTADSITSTASVTGSTAGGKGFQSSIVTGGDGRMVLRLTVVAAVSSGPVITSSAVVGGFFKLTFSGTTGATYSIVSSTDIATPLTSWTVAGTATESPSGSGQFQFTDTLPATGQRFYAVRLP
ncbi:MAG: hypothetical protein ABI042_11830 [Verrucomicrobiota bacterium]